MKAYLQELVLAIPRTHDLNRLLDLLLPTDPSLRVRRGLKGLTAYAVDHRYPGFNANGRKTAAALRICSRVRKAIRQRLKIDRG